MTKIFMYIMKSKTIFLLLLLTLIGCSSEVEITNPNVTESLGERSYEIIDRLGENYKKGIIEDEELDTMFDLFDMEYQYLRRKNENKPRDSSLATSVALWNMRWLEWQLKLLIEEVEEGGVPSIDVRGKTEQDIEEHFELQEKLEGKEREDFIQEYENSKLWLIELLTDE